MIGFTSIPAQLRAHTHGGEKHHVAGRAGERGDAVVFRQANRDTDGEEQRQIAEDGVARFRHDERHAFRATTRSSRCRRRAECPATGRTETGSIMHLPIFCRREKALLEVEHVIPPFLE